jgi:hypothetical protein
MKRIPVHISNLVSQESGDPSLTCISEGAILRESTEGCEVICRGSTSLLAAQQEINTKKEFKAPRYILISIVEAIELARPDQSVRLQEATNTGS